MAGAFVVIEAGLERGVAERLVRQAPRMLQGYEAMFWDTLYATLTPSSALSGAPAGAGEDGHLDE